MLDPIKLLYSITFGRRTQGKRCGKGEGYRLLLYRQILKASASLIKSSRKSGCAKLMSFSARSHVEAPIRLAMPYSVAT